MSSSIEYKDYILNQLGLSNNISCRSMMGEFLLYYNDVLFGGIYDNRLMIKIVKSNAKYNMKTELPYQGGKPMYVVSEIENKQLLMDIILDTVTGLKK